MEKRITEIYCPQCGAPAAFDIVHQQYLCGHCGSSVQVKQAQEIKEQDRNRQSEKLKQDVHNYHLFSAVCSGCGASIVFEEQEALSNCAFCGRSLVRTDYLHTEQMPESVIPFGITLKEAKALLRKWCEEHSSKEEAKELKPILEELKGFYLPYEFVRGPVHMDVRRMDGGRTFHCEGFLEEQFINQSAQLDNLLLDGMEPFDTDAMAPFDFAYVAGQRVKIPDLSQKEETERSDKEAEENYRPAIQKTLETQAVEVEADTADAFRFPVLLPVYYVAKGNCVAAVNGQTGKVSVRALNDSHYYFLPWWLKAIVATVAFGAISFGAFRVFSVGLQTSLLLAGLLTFFFFIVFLCYFSDTIRNDFQVVAGRKIFNSGQQTFTRSHGQLVFNEQILEKKLQPPVFFEKLDKEEEPVLLRFTTPWRVVRMALLCLVALFLPVLIALFLNGFQWDMLNLGGSAVWFCIMVPVVPVYLLKFGIVELHERPWVYRLVRGRPSRVRKLNQKKLPKGWWKAVLRAVFVPPASLAVWFAIISFFVICYLTAGYE